jgi:hypothetical protein
MSWYDMDLDYSIIFYCISMPHPFTFSNSIPSHNWLVSIKTEPRNVRYTDKYQLLSGLLDSLWYDIHFAKATARNYIQKINWTSDVIHTEVKKGTSLTSNKSNMHLASHKFSVFLLQKFHYSKTWIQRSIPNIFNMNCYMCSEKQRKFECTQGFDFK